MNSRELANLLYIELDKKSFGDMDPYWFQNIAKCPPPPEDPLIPLDEHWTNTEELRKVLDAVCVHINHAAGASPDPPAEEPCWPTLFYNDCSNDEELDHLDMSPDDFGWLAVAFLSSEGGGTREDFMTWLQKLTPKEAVKWSER